MTYNEMKQDKHGGLVSTASDIGNQTTKKHQLADLCSNTQWLWSLKSHYEMGVGRTAGFYLTSLMIFGGFFVSVFEVI